MFNYEQWNGRSGSGDTTDVIMMMTQNNETPTFYPHSSRALDWITGTVEHHFQILTYVSVPANMAQWCSLQILHRPFHSLSTPLLHFSWHPGIHQHIDMCDYHFYSLYPLMLQGRLCTSELKWMLITLHCDLEISHPLAVHCLARAQLNLIGKFISVQQNSLTACPISPRVWKWGLRGLCTSHVHTPT